MLRTESLLAAVVLLSGCASDLSERLDGQQEVFGEVILVESQTEGSSTLTRVNASEAQRWVHWRINDDFAESTENLGEVPADEMWDLAFQRFRVRVNGGASGPAGVEVAVLSDVDFDSVTVAPSTGYTQDLPDADDDGDVESVFETVGDGWFIYDFSVHTLSPRPLVYVVKSHEEQFYKLAYVSYYDDAGSSGHPSFRHEAIDPPEPTP
ncbi:MAG: HmuY family protein, partial [Myxococcota bacterium]